MNSRTFQLRKNGDPQGEPIDVTDVRGVQMEGPPETVLGPITEAINRFTKDLGPGQGGLVGVSTIKTDGTLNVNLAVVHKFTDNVSILGWVGKEGSWGEPWEAGFAWKAEWGK